MTFPSTSRVVEISDYERFLLLRLLDAKWWELDKESELTETDLIYLRDIEALQAKLA